MRGLILIALTAIFSSLCFAGQTALSDDLKWVEQGKRLENGGNYEQAIVAFEKAIYLNAENSSAFENSGRIYLKLGDKQTSLDYLLRAYDLNPAPELKKLITDLSDRTYGFQALNFYPLTYDIMLGGGVSYYGGSIGSSFSSGIGMMAFSLNMNFGAFVKYHFNNWFALKTGLLYASSGMFDYKVSYLDVPVAAVFVLGSGASQRHAISAGMYFGPKMSGTFGTGSAYNDADIPGMDYGLHAGYHIYALADKIGFVYGFTLQNSFVQIHPDINVKNLAVLFGIGAAF